MPAFFRKMLPRCSKARDAWVAKVPLFVVIGVKSFQAGAPRRRGPIHAVRYLGEFAYRLNRRSRESNLFAMLLDACRKVQAMTYPELKAAEVR